MRSILLTACAMLLCIWPQAALGSEVAFSDVRIAMEPSDEGLTVKEMVVIKPAGNTDFANALGTSIPLPTGASEVQLAEDLPSEGLVVKNGDILVTGPIPAAGRQAAIRFTLSVTDETVSFDQTFPAPVKLAHAAWVGDADSFMLSGEGFGPSDVGKTPKGTPAIFIAAKDLDSGRLHITLSGFGKNPLDYVSWSAALLSFVLLAAGFVRWGRGRATGDSDFS